MLYLFSIIFSILILVFVHEFGHYYVALKSGVHIEQFSIGFGKEIYSIFDKRGTKWSLCMIPLGGYVRMRGDSNPSSLPDPDLIKSANGNERSQFFALQPLANRAAIVAAGPLMNYLFACIIITCLFFAYGKPHIPAIIDYIAEDSPAMEAGILPGDKIISFDGDKISNFSDLQEKTMIFFNKRVNISILRDSKIIDLDLLLSSKEITDKFGYKYKIGYIGVSPVADVEYRSYNVIESFGLAVSECFRISKMTLQNIAQLIMGSRSSEELGSIIRISQYSNEIIQISFVSYLWFLSFLSINLGLINLLPLPVLDGGFLFYFLYEFIVGKPISNRMQKIFFKIGYIFIIFFTVLSFSNDIKHLLVH